MRFCDKLPKLRKENNLSQEQLADRLGLSRQAVSKWESGTSYPDMDKIVTLCKILNCSLDELIDDAAIGNAKRKEERVNVNTYLKEVLDFITKTINMFWSMRLIEKIKCILEMGCILIILIVFGLIIKEVLHVLLYQVISLLPDFIYISVEKIATLFYGIFALTLGTIIFIHIFKIRYLDYFVTIEDKQTNKKSIEKPVEEHSKEENEKDRVFLEKKKNKIIIRDPIHSTYNFFYILAKFGIFILKIMASMILFGFVLTLITLVIIDIFSILHIKDGIFFLGTTLALIATTTLNYLILELLYNFIFNQKYHFKRTFIIFITSVIVLGVGIGLSINEYLSFKAINIKEGYKTITKNIEYKENLVFPMLEHSNVNLIEDETISDIKIEFIIPKETDIILDKDINIDDQSIYYHWFLTSDYESGMVKMNKIINKLVKKERIDLKIQEVKIYTNKKIIENLLDNNY